MRYVVYNRGSLIIISKSTYSIDRSKEIDLSDLLTRETKVCCLYITSMQHTECILYGK